MALTTVRLIVDDVEGCARFYKEAFGFEEKVNAGVYIALTAGACELGFYKRDLMDSVLGGKLGEGPPDGFLLNIEVDSVDEMASKLAEQGTELVTQPHDQAEWFMRVAHVRDPAGNLVEIFQSTYQGEES